MGLTSEKSLVKVQELYDKCFEANAIFDRIYWVASITYNQNNFSDWFHHHIAHYATGDDLADSIGKFAEIRSDLLYRGAIAEHKEEYDTLTEAMEQFVMTAIGLRKACVEALKVCAENSDEDFEDYLRDLNFTKIAPLIRQATVFYEAVKEYEVNNDLRKWNKDYKAYIISEFGGEL